jgi:predicted aspartyl protease
MIRKLLLAGAVVLAFAGHAEATTPGYVDAIHDAEARCRTGDVDACREAKNLLAMYAQAMCADSGAARAAAACRFANIPNPAPKAPDASTPTPLASGHSEIALHREGGVLTVPVSINGAITLEFTIDSGAADVSIPADVVMTLMRTGTIARADFLGSRTYVMADGSTAPSTIFRIRSLRVGDREVRNVTASIASVKGGLLLGQSFLRQFGSWSIDNGRGVLVLD